MNNHDSLRVRVVVDLSFSDLEVAPHEATRVFGLPGGGWGVTSSVFGGYVARFDDQGNSLEPVGRSGAGPGEFGGELFGVQVGDEIWLVDPGNARLHRFSGDFDLEGDRTLPGRVFWAAAAPDSTILISGFFSQANQVFGVARISSDPSRDTFGLPIDPAQPPRTQVHYVAHVGPEEIWAFPVSHGVVKVLDTKDLTVVDQMEVPELNVDWRRVELNRPPAPVPAHLTGVSADEKGRIWVGVAMPIPNTGPPGAPRASARPRLATSILVIDAKRRQIVGRGRFDAVCIPFEGRQVSCIDEGAETVRVLEVELPG